MSFDPDDDFAGLASFAYSVDDQQGHSVAGAVTVEVLPPSNRPPVAEDTILTVEAGTPLTIDLAALVTDPDPNDTLTFTSTGPSAGAVTLAANGSTVVATAPLEGTDTTDSFQYTVTDAAGEAATATVSLTVTAPAAPPPQAQGDQATTNQGQAVTVAVLGNDLDPLGRGLTVTSVGATAAGSATTDGSNVTFTPNPDFFGPASFIYRIRDGANTAQREAEAQVAVTVIGQPSAPGTPVAREGNATATVTWAAPPSNGAPIDDYELRIEGGSSVNVGTATGLHVGRPDERRARLVQRPRPQQRRLGSVERPVARRDAGHRARPPGRADGAVRRPGAHRHRGRPRPTRAARSRTTTSRSAATPRPCSASAPRRSSAGRG